MKIWISFLVVLIAITGIHCQTNAKITITQLRCEYLTNPLGIDSLQPRLSWQLESSERGQFQTAYRILVSDSKQKLNQDVGELWDSGKIISDRSNQIEYQGESLKSRQNCFWKVCVWDKNNIRSDFSPNAIWTMGLLQTQEWPSKWIALDRPTEEKPADYAPGPPPPWFRRSFSLEKQLERAFVYVSARGIFELYVNGNRVGQDIFAPEWTDYSTRIQYRTYDVTDMLKFGPNAVGAIVGDGWYSGYVGMRRQRGNYGLQNSLLLCLDLEFKDGSKQSIITDKSWRCTEGPIISSDLLMGEKYDARREMSGWATAEFDDNSWQHAVVVKAPESLLKAQPSEPIQITELVKPIRVTEPAPLVYVFDLGQNIAGWARLKVSGEAGTEVTLRFAERLNPDGTVYTQNLRRAQATDTYILKGIGEEIFEPRFTFHGFQYVAVTGFPGIPTKDSITGCAINSAAPSVGTFFCSNPMVNKLYSNLFWSQRANYISIPTDCPQRDERLGWMGDAQIFVRTGTYNMDTAAFFTKWMQDVEDAQSPAGAYPDFAPRLNDKTLLGFEAAPAWGDAGIIIPWTIYRVYGDTRIIRKHWQSMERWMEYLQNTNPDLIRRKGVNNNYGDWLSIEADTPKDLLATAYWAHDAALMAQMAKILETKEAAEKYKDLFAAIKSIFQLEFVNPDGTVKGDTQTGYLLALAMDLMPEELIQPAAQKLHNNIREQNWHLSTGFVGCGYLNPVLTSQGYNETAYRLLLNETFPSWGYSIKQGATSIWERWDGWTKEKGFQDPGMNSFNHYSFGAIGEWLFRYAAGIDLHPEIPGYKKIQIKPFPGKGLDFARAEYHSIHGRIFSGWERQGQEMILKVKIPVNTSATLFVPATDIQQIKESGRAIKNEAGVKFLRKEEKHTVFEIGSGDYVFSFPFEL